MTSHQAPNGLESYALFLPLIGELVITFSRVEKRITWAIESLLESTRDEAHQLEQDIIAVSGRIRILNLIGRIVARQTSTTDEFANIIGRLNAANSFRNHLLHNSFPGVSFELNGDREVIGSSLIKERWHDKPEKRSYSLSADQIREATEENLAICTEIQRWILSVRPNAENRVP